MDVASGEVRCLARAEDLLSGRDEVLSPDEKARRERRREIGRGLTWFELSTDGRRVLVGVGGRLFVIDRSAGKITPLRSGGEGAPLDARFSPDGRFVSFVRNHNIYLVDLSTLTERALTVGGTEDLSFGVAEFVAQEEMDRHYGYWWSDDSRWLAYQETDQREVEKLFVADARRPDSPPQGYRYPRAGQANARVRLAIVPVAGGPARWVEWDREQYPYLATVRWGPDDPLTIYVQSRDQRKAILYRVEPESARAIELLRESDEAWLNIDPDVPRWLASRQEFIWTSERSGERQLELRRHDGTLVRVCGVGAARLGRVVALDRGRREVIVTASADPAQTHLFRLSLRSDRQVVALTDGAGVHSGVFSRDCNVWVDIASLADGRTGRIVRGRDATVRGEIPSVAEQPPWIPRPEIRTVEAEDRTYHAALLRPRDFTRGRRYPVIESVYGGPHVNVVTASPRHYLRQQWLADQGFVVVLIDGRGTPRRGRDWERAIKGNLIDLPLADHVTVLQALARACPELDLSRVGIYGWSFGGYFSTMAVLRRPDVYHAAVAGAPVIDWNDYDTHYTERYLGLPAENAEGYRACSALTWAADLERPLLLIHGTTDDNVYLTHTLKMAEALFRAGKPYKLLILPGFTHMVPEPVVNVRLHERIARFFHAHLVERQPRPRSAQAGPVAVDR